MNLTALLFHKLGLKLMGVCVSDQAVALFSLSVNESHLCVFKIHEVTGRHFCFVQASQVRDKLIFKVGSD